MEGERLEASGPSTKIERSGEEDIPPPCKNMTFQETVYMQYRLHSFTKWPHVVPTAEEVARAGFQYIGPADQTKCIVCHGIACQWEIKDDPLAEHLRLFPNCPLAQKIAGHSEADYWEYAPYEPERE